MGKKFGEYLKQCRLKKKIGLREMERLTEGKIKAPYLSRIESGRENPPGPERLEIIAKLLEIDMDEIFYLAEKVPKDLSDKMMDATNEEKALFRRVIENPDQFMKLNDK